MGLTTKQKQVFEFIRDYIASNGLSPTQREIKDHFKLKSFGSVQRYIGYLVDLNLIENDQNARRGITIAKKRKKKSDTDLPLLGNISAGDPILAIENPTETIPVPSHMIQGAGRHFALKIAGDSMIELGILNDDVVVCKQTQNVEQGQVAVCLINGDATLKKFYKHSDHIELVPANQNYSPIKVYPDDNFAILGSLTGLVRVY